MNRSNWGDGSVPHRVCFATIRLLALGALLGVGVSSRATEVITPRRLIEVVDISGPVVSPDGKHVAFRTEQASVKRNTYDSIWYVQNMDDGSPPRRVGDGGIPLRGFAGLSVLPLALWSADGRWIYYRALIDGRVDVWRAGADGSGAKALTLDAADVRQFSLSVDDGILKYSVGATRDEVIAAEQAEYERGIRIDKTVPIGEGNLFRSGNIEGRLATQRLSGRLDRVPLLADVPERWKEIDLATGRSRDIAPSEALSPSAKTPALPKELPQPWRLVHDPLNGRIALLTRVGDRGHMVQKPNVEMAILSGKNSQRPIKCQAELCVNKEITNIQWRPHTDEVMYTVSDSDEGGAQSIFRWNVETGVVLQVTQSGGLLNGGERYGRKDPGCGLSLADMVCVTAKADRPPRLEKIDLESGDRQILFEPNASLAKDFATTMPARLLRWTDAKGQSFTGQLFEAKRVGGAPTPLFVSYYVCPGFLRSAFGDDWPLATFAEHGISALCINHAPVRFNAVERYNQALSGVEGAVELLASSGEIDRTKVGMGGLSFGTEITMWTAFNSNLLAATSITAAVPSLSMYLHTGMKGDEFHLDLAKEWQLSSFDETPEQWKRIGLQFNLGKIGSPTLMQIPEQEYEWLLDSAVPLMRDHKADMYVFPNAPHFKFQPKQLLAANERNVDWFRFWLQGFEDNNPSKSEQYKHWRVMRDHQCERSANDGHTEPWYCPPS